MFNCDPICSDNMFSLALVASCSVVAVFAIVGAGFFAYRFKQQTKAAADIEYPAYGVVGPVSTSPNGTGPGTLSPSGDRKLALSAQMYHYHHQKQQMIASETSRKDGATSRHQSASDNEEESDYENDEGEYTVYECPGLASTGEMEVKNPMFIDECTPTPQADSPIRKATTSSADK